MEKNYSGEISQKERALVSKHELATALHVSYRTVEELTARRVIPRLRISSRLIRYDLSRVLAALNRYEIKEVQ